MVIVAASTLAEVFTAQTWGPSADEAAAWTAATKAFTASTVTTKVGIFTDDLTAFRADCALATTNCVPATYASTAFNGIAVGINWTSSIAAEATINGLCFTTSKKCAEITFAATNTFEAYTAAAAIAAASPTATGSDVTTLSSVNPFLGYYGVMVANSAKT